jgi:lipid-binding SYLF domain-containing protein
MANITNPEVVKFANEKIRVMADMQVAHYRTAKQFKAAWDAAGLSAIFAVSNADVVVDGAATDGRHTMTSFDANNTYNRAVDTINEYEASANTKLNQANAIAVNTHPLF